ncbi:MAG: SCO family protein [Balneolaceae bacterium]
MQSSRSIERTLLLTAIAAGTVLLVLLSGCDELSIKTSLQGESYELVSHHSETATFPGDFSGKVTLVGYVYTACPDICPIITFNMRDIQDAIPDDQPFALASISFDPDRDTPERLQQYAKSFRLGDDNWTLLTGERSSVERVLQRLEIATMKSPTRFMDDGTPIYFIDHSDKVTLLDADGNVRKTYVASTLNTDEVVQDIHTLLNEINPKH